MGGKVERREFLKAMGAGAAAAALSGCGLPDGVAGGAAGAPAASEARKLSVSEQSARETPR